MKTSRLALLPIALALLAMSARAPAQGNITPIPNTCASALQMSVSGNGGIGMSLVFLLQLAIPVTGSPSPGLLVFGQSGRAWNGGAIPQLLDPLHPNLAGCTQLAAADVIVGVTSWTPSCSYVLNMWMCFPPFHAGYTATLPQNPALIGLTFRTQALVFWTMGPEVSNGFRITIG